MEWKVTLINEKFSRITVWVDAETEDEAKDNAFNHPKVIKFTDGYDGLITISILTKQQASKIEINQEPNENL